MDSFNIVVSGTLSWAWQKTKVMIFNGSKINKHNFTFNDNLIEIEKEYKYVGTIFSTNSQNAFKINSSYLIEKASRPIFGLKSHIKDSVGFLSLDLSVKMFDKQIRPILDYVCEVCYMGKQDHDIEKIHLGYILHQIQNQKSPYLGNISL